MELVLWFCCYVLLAAGRDITDPAEVDALRIIKNNLIDPNGNLSNWTRGDPCTSNWAGVLCFNTTLVDGYLHVQELRLMSLNLSGTLAPEIGQLANMEILNFMWNNISGRLPKEIGNIKSLLILLLNGNQLTGELPDELGYLPNLDRIQIDQNHINGSLPRSFANLNKTQHFHMNNNSISGPIPAEISSLPNLVHILLDNNNLSGPLPRELSQLPRLKILQLDNNNLGGSTIPDSYVNMSNLLKLSLRNCSLQGHIPDFSTIPKLHYLDLSYNQLNGTIPTNKLSDDITTIDLSNNKLIGTIPSNFSSLPNLQKLSVANNSLNGSVPSTVWQKSNINGTGIFTLDFENNDFTNISGTASLTSNNTLRLGGNPLCSNASLAQFCGSESGNDTDTLSETQSTAHCRIQSCRPPYEYSKSLPKECFCAAPFIVGYRLKSPGFSDFLPFFNTFQTYLTNGLSINISQLYIESIRWQEGPRLGMYLKIFPAYVGLNSSHTFDRSEVQRLINMLASWGIPDSDLFGPYELINYTLLYPYGNVIVTSSSPGRSKVALLVIMLVEIVDLVILSIIVILRTLRLYKRRNLSKISIKIDGVRSFTYGEMALATNNFSESAQVGQGGFGKVYKGVLADGTVVAIKCAQKGSLQGEREFLAEIQSLSKLHHRNLVSLFGYCDEKGEQMLVYEFMQNGTLRDHLSVSPENPLSFAMRLRIALGSAKGILYLHTEVDPPIFHRDIKASNILLDSKFIAKVSDFGLSRLGPVPDEGGHVPSHVSTVPKGTPGYLDPKYFLTHELTDKSDVYSLGVVYLELLTWMKAISRGENIVEVVRAAYKSGDIFSIIGQRAGFCPSDCVEKFLNLALRCCEHEPDARPKIGEVVRELEDIWAMMPESDNKTAESVSPMDIDSSPPSSPTTAGNTSVSPMDIEVTTVECAPPWH